MSGGGVVRGPAGSNDCRIYVGNLPPDIRSKDVEDLFYKYGAIRDIDRSEKPKRRTTVRLRAVRGPEVSRILPPRREVRAAKLHVFRRIPGGNAPPRGP